MIHLSSRSPLEGFDVAIVYGKGPSYDPDLVPDDDVPNFPVSIGINDAATPYMDFVALRDWTTCDRLWANKMHVKLSVITEQRVWFRRPDRYGVYDLYFDGTRVLGSTTDSKTVPGRKLGVGTATAVLQLLGQARVKEVYLNGFDAFFGGEIRYAPCFEDRGLSHEDYAEAFPVSGTPEEQAALVRESMQYVIDAYRLNVKELR